MIGESPDATGEQAIFGSVKEQREFGHIIPSPNPSPRHRSLPIFFSISGDGLTVRRRDCPDTRAAARLIEICEAIRSAPGGVVSAREEFHNLAPLTDPRSYMIIKSVFDLAARGTGLPDKARYSSARR
jgi:hypothetical protein